MLCHKNQNALYAEKRKLCDVFRNKKGTFGEYLVSNSNEPVDNAIGLCCHDLCNIFKIAVFNEISILDTGLFRLALTIRLSILHRMFDYSASHPK